MRNLMLVGGIAVLVGACSSEPMFTGTADGNAGAPGLAQHVLLSTATPAVGDSITIRSVVTNQSRAAITFAGIDGGGLRLAGVSFEDRSDVTAIGSKVYSLAPGDSQVVTMITTPITATPGDYQLDVQQLGGTPVRGVNVSVRVEPSPSNPEQ